MVDFSHLTTKSIIDGNKKIVTTIDAESNRVLRKVEYVDRNGDGRFAFNEISNVSIYAYSDNIMSVRTRTDSDFSGYFDISQTTIYQKDSNGEYSLWKRHITHDGLEPTDYQKKHGYQNMKERAFNIEEIEWYQEEINVKADDVKRGLTTW